MGTKKNVLLDTDDFCSISRRLQNARIFQSDFEAVIDKARKDDFVFVDPPYTVKHNFNNFIKYNETLFSWEDQVRLKHSLIRAKSRGARILMTNAYHSSVKALYRDLGDFLVLKRPSVIAASSEHRRACEELVIRVG
jgi:DNA adenine methylase